MKLPDGTILMHGRAPYDPVKAHQYYLRTRQLKGRKKGESYTVKTDKGQVVLTASQLAEQKAYAAKRVSDIKSRLAELNVKFKKMIADAERKEAKSERDAKKAPTAAEKSEVARESKKYREKHKQELSTKSKTSSKTKSTSSKPKLTPVAAVGRRINQAEDRLRTAVARQRALNSATRNR